MQKSPPSHFIEFYEKELLKNPKSKTFAALAEAYRKSDQVEKAIETAKRGINYHPEFSSGHVALGQALMEFNEYDEAYEHFSKACQLSPDNILAQIGLGRSSLQLRQTKKALNAYKNVLFINPDHKEAQKAIRKLESLTADEFEEDLFQIRPLSRQSFTQRIQPDDDGTTPLNLEDKKLLHRKLSLLDAFIARNDLERAHDVLTELSARFPHHQEVKRRSDILQTQEIIEEDDSIDLIQPVERQQSLHEIKKQALEKILFRVSEWRQSENAADI